ncbi:MAG: hypothetical protein AAGC63_00450 [Propionicimonas sp.]|nr:hypothetical protein [Propionicimonas sp.]
MRSVGKELNFASSESVPGEVEAAWPGWQELHPELRVVDAGGLRAWLKRVPGEESDRVLRVLARRASEQDDDDHAARVALVWALLPGAGCLASRYRHVPNPNFMVAEQLWIQASEFPWRTTSKVAANVLAKVRNEVLREIGASSRPDPAERLNASATQYVDTWRSHIAPAEQTGAGELHDLLDHAVDTQVITPWDRALLLVAVEVGYDASWALKRDSCLGGLTGNTFSALVAERLGCSARTVRRRIHLTIQALRDSLPHLLDELRDAA